MSDEPTSSKVERDDRFTFNAGGAKSDIEWLTTELGVTKTEVLRAAVRFYRVCRETDKQGGRVLIKENPVDIPARVWFT